MQRKTILLLFVILVTLVMVGCGGTETAPPETEPETGAATQAPQPSDTPEPEPQAETESQAAGMPSPTPTPEADPRVELGGADWVASFGKDTEQTWGQFDDEQAKVEMKPDALVLTAHKANSFDVWSMSYPVLEDFYLEITGTSGDVCSGKDRYGPIVRAPDNNQGYLYQISCDGMFTLRKWDGVEYTDLISWTPSEHIVPGPNQTHRLGIMAEGTNLSVYVNGFLHGEAVDESYDKGMFGISVAAADTPGFTVTVTEVLYWELP
ncbi:MAG: hypothetical protein KAI94_01400 [Anaerolineales bacterium]|nr:hypothetical protein [Anaerolineales bacterium]